MPSSTDKRLDGGCDEDLPKQRIINKRRTQTVLDNHLNNHLTPTFFELSLVRLFHQHGVSLAEALTLYISVVFSTQIHNIVCISSNHHQVVFFRYIRSYKEGLLVTLHLDVYCGLYCQKTGSIRVTRC